MVEVHTDEMDKIDREIRNRYDRGEKRVLEVLKGVNEETVLGKGVEDFTIYGGNRYWIITTNLWGLNVCAWEG